VDSSGLARWRAVFPGHVFSGWNPIALDTYLEERIRAIVDEHVNERVEELRQSPWMDVKQTAAYLGIGTSRLYKLSAQSVIPHRKQEGRLMFHRGEVDAWLNDYRRGPATATASPLAGGDNPEVASLLEEIISTPLPSEEQAT